MSTKKMQIIGLKGKSAYQYAQDGGYTGTEAEFKEKMAKELDAVYDYEDLNEAILATAIKPETSGEFIHITDSAALPIMDFGMEGKTEQFTTSGKNLCDLQVGKKFNPFTGEIGEAANYAMCTIEASEEMSVTVSIPSTEEHGWYLSYMYHNGTVTNIYNKIFAGQSKTITLPKGTVMLSGDAIIDNVIMADEFKPIKVQIELGSTATTYEPYTNGPSPNPDYPQEIVNAGVYNEATGRYEIGCCVGGSNFLVYDCEKTYSVLGVDFTVNKDGSVTIKGTNTTTNVASDFMLNEKMLLKAGAYILTNAYDTTKVCLHVIGTSSYIYSDSQYNVIRLTTDAYVKVYIRTEAGATVDTIAYPMLRLEGDNSIFTPISNPLTLTSPVPLTKWDYLTKRDGVWGWRVPSRYKKFLLDNWKIANRDSNRGGVFFVYKNFVDDHINTSDEIQLCTHFIPINPYSHIGDDFWLNNSELRVGLSDETITTVEAFVEKLESLGEIGLWYESTTEEFHPLPDNEQALLKELETYYKVTNIYNDQNCPMSIQYIADTQTYIDNLANSLTNAVVSLGGEV